MTIERNSEAAGLGNFARVSKVAWQPVSRDMWLVPAIQQGLISASRGSIITLGGLMVTGLVWSGLNLWDIVLISVVAGTIVALADFTGSIGERFELYRESEVSRETYERETTGSAARIDERVVIESHETTDGGYGRTLYDQLRCSQSDLKRLACVDALSVRELQDSGFSFEFAKRILGELTKQGFIRYEADNKPAHWTSKGRALVHHYQNVE